MSRGRLSTTSGACLGAGMGFCVGVTILLALLVVDGVSAEELRIPLAFDANKLQRVQDDSGVYFLLDGARSFRDEGDDPLPIASFTLRIPSDRRVASARVIAAQARVLGAKTIVDSEFPQPVLTLLGESWWHGERLAQVHYQPLVPGTDPDSWVLWEGGEIVLALEPGEVPSGVVRRVRQSPEQARHQWNSLRGILQNPEALPSPSSLPPGPELRSTAESISEGPISKAPSLDTGPYRYLIVTTSELASTFQELVDYRERQGLPGIVVTVDEIVAVTRQGQDLAETIRYYLQDAYSRWGVDYVMLGGDTEIIPTRNVISTFYPPDGQSEIPADMYFAGLDGNWNADGDALYGEPYRSGADPGDFADFVPELAVGRAPVRNAAEAQIFVDKVQAYENGGGGDRLARGVFASEVLFPQDWTPGSAVIRDGATFSQSIIATIQNWGQGTWEAKRLYQNYTMYPGAVEETRAALIADMDSGDYGLVHHIGHGFYYNMSVGDANFLASDADGLINGSRTFVLIALNCGSAAFDVNCLLERFIRNPNGGSVASIGSSRAAFDNTTNEYQQALYRVLYKARRQRLGDAILESRLGFVPNTFFDTVDRWSQLVFTLLGDPAMRMWTGVPRPAVVDAPSSVQLGSPDIEVVVHDDLGAVVDSAAVVLLGGNNQMLTGWTGSDGRVRIPLTVGETGSWQLHVNGRNLVPSTRSLNIVPAPSGHLSLAGWGMDDGAGNGNGRPEAGELIRLTAVLRNGGTSTVGAGALSLSTEDPWVVVDQPDATYSALAPGAQSSASAAFELRLASDAPDGHLATLDLLLEENGGARWYDFDRFEIAGSAVEILELDLDDSLGNGDGIVDPGEELSLVFNLKNYASGRVDGVTGVLSSLDPEVVILDGDASWGAMDGALSSARNQADPFRVQENDTSIARLYRLDLQTSSGLQWSLEFDLRRPPAPTDLQTGTASTNSILLGWAPSFDADLAGYRVYRRAEGEVPWSLLSPDLLRSGSVFLDEGLESLSVFEYQTTAVAESGLEGPRSASIVLATPPPEISCFPLPVAQEVTGANAVGHLDADGVPDLVVGSELVYVIDGNCQEKLDGDRNGQTLGPIHSVEGSFHQAGVAIGDLDGVGDEELVASNWESRKLYVYDGNGELVPGWPVLLAQSTWTTPVLGDLDQDGDLEIVINDIAGWTYAFHHDGSEVADGDGDPARVGPIAPRRTGEWFGRTTPALLDVTGDGRPEILFGSNFGAGLPEYFYALRGDGGGNAPNWPRQFVPGSSFLSSPAVGDIDRDGQLEIVVPCQNDSLYVWNQDGSAVRDFPIFHRARSLQFDSQAPSPALVDFEGDGLLEIVAVAVHNYDDARIHVYDVNGDERAGWPQLVPGLSESSPVVGDLDGDASLDIVFGIGGGAADLPSLLFAFHSDGTGFQGFPIRLDAWVRATPTICDFNLDGRANLVLASWDLLIHVWDLGGSYDPALAPWPTFHGNSRRDGHANTASPKREIIALDTPTWNQPRLEGNHPNPFNPSTVIRFEIPAEGARGELAVFDAAGRRIRTLLRGVLPGGPQELRWDGRDSSGAEVASGVYFARLDLEGEAPLSRKMALLR